MGELQREHRVSTTDYFRVHSEASSFPVLDRVCQDVSLSWDMPGDQAYLVLDA